MDVASVIADPVRREILEALRGRVLTAGELAERFDISRPAVSRHLRVLRQSGLVEDEVEGRHRFYRLDPSPLEPLAAWIAELRSATDPADRWSGALDALETEVYRTRRERRASSSSSSQTGIEEKSA